MQTDIFVRSAKPEDREQLVAWAKANAEKNWFDEDVLNYPLTKVLVAYKGDKIICYMPIQPMLMLDSLAPNPEASSYELASAMRMLLGAAMLNASDVGIQEIGFWSTNEGTGKAAQLVGFKQFPLSLMRFKFPQKREEEKQVSTCV